MPILAVAVSMNCLAASAVMAFQVQTDPPTPTIDERERPPDIPEQQDHDHNAGGVAVGGRGDCYL